jgi:hypothetical protein
MQIPSTSFQGWNEVDFLGGETCRQPIFIYKEVWKLSSQKLTL